VLAVRKNKRAALSIGALFLGMLCILSIYARAKPEYSPPKKITLDRMFQLAKLCSTYKTLAGSWPTNTVSLSGVVWITNRSVLSDAWGNRFVFYTDSPGTTFFIVSYGADGKPKGTGDDGDITWILNKPTP